MENEWTGNFEMIFEKCMWYSEIKPKTTSLLNQYVYQHAITAVIFQVNIKVQYQIPNQSHTSNIAQAHIIC